MTTHLFALGNRATTITAIAAALLAATLIATPASAQAAGATTAPVLTEGMGMSGAPSKQVRRMQLALDRRGYDLGAPGVDGRFGPLTATAVRRFQARHRLVVDGIVGVATRRELGLGRRAARRERPGTATRQRPRRDADPSTTAQAKQSGPKAATERPKAATERPKAATERPKAATAQATAVAAREHAPAAASPASTTPDVAPAGSSNLLDDWRVAIAIGAAAALLVAGLSALGMTLARRRAYRPPAPSGGVTAGATHFNAPDLEPTAGAGTPAVASPAPSTGPAEPRRLSVIDGTGPPAIAFVRANEGGPPLPPRARVVGYARLPRIADGPAERSRARAIEEACEQRGWELVAVLHDRADGHRPRRPPLLSALQRVATGEAEGLVVADVDDVHRSVGRGGALAAWLRDADTALVAHELAPVGTPDGGRAPVALIKLDGRPSLEKRRLG